MLCYAMLTWDGKMIEVLTVALSREMNEKDVHYGDAKLFPYAMLAVFPLNDFSECLSTSERSQTGLKVPSRPVQWLAANTSGQ